MLHCLDYIYKSWIIVWGKTDGCDCEKSWELNLKHFRQEIITEIAFVFLFRLFTNISTVLFSSPSLLSGSHEMSMEIRASDRHAPNCFLHLRSLIGISFTASIASIKYWNLRWNSYTFIVLSCRYCLWSV